jgi:DNA-binding NarL/FixJ family response regulator
MTVAIRVLIVDDHAVVRAGTRRILEESPDIQVVGEAGDGLEAVELARRAQPDVVILDVRLPGQSGVAAVRDIVALPGTRVLIFSAYEDDDYVLAAMRAGASGYILKTAPLRELPEAVRAVHRGETVLHPAITRRIARLWAQRPPSPYQGRQLTPREAEVLRLVAQGLRNREVAQRLGLSRRTVDGHLAAIFAKLGVSTRTEAAMYAVTHHLVPAETPEGEG